MQSIFRLPWSTDPGIRTGALDKAAFHKPSRPKPIVDIPSAAAAAVAAAATVKVKRKRVDGSDPSPRNPSKQKKLKAVSSGGAVQPAMEPTKGPDASPALTPVVVAQVKDGRLVVGSTGLLELSRNSQSSQQALPVVAAKPGVDSVTRADISASNDSSLPQSATSAAIASMTQESQKTPAAPELQSSPTEKTKMAVSSEHLRSIIEAQFNQEILFKHNEIRLIEQEVAKCQVALEQLRRCELIPYPGFQDPSLDVASGMGPAMVTPHGYNAPRHPAPWGVTDGPYTRHYAKWLMPSPTFDPTSVQATPAHSPYPKDMRVTRGSGVDVTPVNLWGPRPSRSTAGRSRFMQDQSSPTFGRDPLVIKRAQDGEWVKLYCSNCQPERSDFANVQGFLNHCRISHKLDFKSHEAAAIACGRVVHAGEGMKVPEPVPPPRDHSSRSSIAIAPSPIDGPLVHSLIKKMAVANDAASSLAKIVPRSYSTPASMSQASHKPVSASFVPSNQTPYLSDLLKKQGYAGNLESTVSEAKRKFDLSVYEDSESDSEAPSSKRSKSGKSGKSTSKVAPMSQVSTPSLASYGRSQSKNTSRTVDSSSKHSAVAKNVAKRAPGRLPAPIKPPSMASTSLRREMLPESPELADQDMELSPHTAADSNPGLVSDYYDEDDGDEDDSTSEDQRAGHRMSGVEVDGVLVEIEDSDGEGSRGDREAQSFCGRAGRGNGSL